MLFRRLRSVSSSSWNVVCNVVSCLVRLAARHSVYFARAAAIIAALFCEAVCVTWAQKSAPHRALKAGDHVGTLTWKPGGGCEASVREKLRCERRALYTWRAAVRSPEMRLEMKSLRCAAVTSLRVLLKYVSLTGEGAAAAAAAASSSKSSFCSFWSKSVGGLVQVRLRRCDI